MDFLEEQISLVEQKFESLSTKKEMESFLLEKKFFENGQNIILKTKFDPSINFVSFFNGVTSHQTDLDRYHNQYLIFGNRTHLTLRDLSGVDVVVKELGFNAKQFHLTSEKKQQVPKLFVLSEKDDLVMFQITFTKTSKRNIVEYEFKAKQEFNVWDKANFKKLNVAPTLSDTAKREVDTFSIKQHSQKLMFHFSDK